MTDNPDTNLPDAAPARPAAEPVGAAPVASSAPPPPASAGPATIGRSGGLRRLVSTPGRAAAVAVAATLVFGVVPCTVAGAAIGAVVVGEHGYGDGGEHGDGRGHDDEADGRGENGENGTERGDRDQRPADTGPTSTTVPTPGTTTPLVPSPSASN
ncbi:hypothetical protein KZZ52_43040 [Dactylosporangium sp. AC04546]|uniref:hypothetical protein n=1 Tax=Dactylosporangium sp. AC04546 TaxID=2862460 RepID=UPI001EDDAB2D|nr:hypothetical protein [Dactylosporangium sp. AC04546]WVK80689.1 hypothetical protein KZZ52_43040 [Dactylosporangium sp. AC04546]